MSELVNLVEHHDHLLVASITHLLQSAVYHLDLFLELGMGNVHDVNEDVTVTHLVKRTLERLHQMGRQFADEADGVGQQEGQIGDDDLAHRRVEGGEEFVLGKDLALT